MYEPAGAYWAYAYRMPFVPLLLAALTLLLHNFRAIFLVKDALCAVLLLFAIERVTRKALIALTLVGVVYLLPWHASLLSQIDTEEAYLFFLAAALAAIMFTRRRADYLAVSALVASIYLCKSSTVLLCLCAAALVLVQDARIRMIRMSSFAPLGALVLAVCVWGGAMYHYAGTFAVGANASSWNGWNFYKGNNAVAASRYPSLNLDRLDDVGALAPPASLHISTEWQMNSWQRHMGELFISSHPSAIARMDLRKVAVVLIDIREAPERPGGTRIDTMFCLLIDHLAFAAAAILALRRRDAGALCFLVLSAAAVLPYFSSFVYQRHLLPMYAFAWVYIAYEASRRIREVSSLASASKAGPIPHEQSR
jgi:hypothetical protein